MTDNSHYGFLRARTNNLTAEREFVYFLIRRGKVDPDQTSWFQIPTGHSWPSYDDAQVMALLIRCGKNLAFRFSTIDDAAAFIDRIVPASASETADTPEAITALVADAESAT